uniref:Uncharacterized protein n=1 Tax=Oscillatoriales cyanobacterium SpSt-402 TaxID=2282168 RepID=A0A832H3E3_9CYAN
MTLERKIATAFHMSEETWARHANPRSVWTRFTVLPMLILAIWSRIWLGWWSLAPIAIAPSLPYPSIGLLTPVWVEAAAFWSTAR